MCLNETLTYSSLDFRDPPPPCSLARDFNRFAVREDVQPVREDFPTNLHVKHFWP